MKNLILCGLVLLMITGACKKNISLEDAINPSDVAIIVQETDTPNVYRFINGQIGKTGLAKWDFGNQVTATGDTVKGRYPFAGDYKVTMTIFGGISPIEKSVNIKFKTDNIDLDPVYGFLTGGKGSATGKTWVLDSLLDGHVKLINNGSTTPWNKLSKSGKGVYDDELTFKLDDYSCFYNNHGNSYCHGGTIDGAVLYRLNELKANWGTVPSYTVDGTGTADLMINYTPKKPIQSWKMVIRDGKHFLQLQDGAFFFFYRGISNVIEYEINSVSENELIVTHYETAPASRANALWRDQYTLIKKGYVRP